MRGYNRRRDLPSLTHARLSSLTNPRVIVFVQLSLLDVARRLDTRPLLQVPH